MEYTEKTTLLTPDRDGENRRALSRENKIRLLEIIKRGYVDNGDRKALQDVFNGVLFIVAPPALECCECPVKIASDNNIKGETEEENKD